MLVPAFDLTRLAQQSGGSIDSVADVYFDLGKRFAFDWLMNSNSSTAQTPWQREAMANVMGDLTSIQRRLAAMIVGKGKDKKGASPHEKLVQWLERHKSELAAYDAQILECRTAGAPDLAMLTLAAQRLNEL